LDKNLGKIIHKAFECRTDGDYGIFIQFKKDEVLLKLEEMRKFITELEKRITSEN